MGEKKYEPQSVEKWLADRIENDRVAVRNYQHAIKETQERIDECNRRIEMNSIALEKLTREG